MGSNRHELTMPFDVESQLIESVRDDESWQAYISAFRASRNSVHMAILVEPYLTYILEGKKTIESRFSLNRQAPYHKVCRGDIILLKRSGGPIVGACQVTEAWFYLLDSLSWKEIRDEFLPEIFVHDPDFWRVKEKAIYATLIRISRPRSISPIDFKKKDRRGWVILSSPVKQNSLDEMVNEVG